MMRKVNILNRVIILNNRMMIIDYLKDYEESWTTTELITNRVNITDNNVPIDRFEPNDHFEQSEQYEANKQYEPIEQSYE